MLSPRLTNCIECASINALLADIDCKILELVKKEYNNLTLDLNYPLSGTLLDDLLVYKRVLTYRYCNKEYGGNIDYNQLSNRVKVLINK